MKNIKLEDLETSYNKNTNCKLDDLEVLYYGEQTQNNIFVIIIIEFFKFFMLFSFLFCGGIIFINFNIFYNYFQDFITTGDINNKDFSIGELSYAYETKEDEVTNSSLSDTVNNKQRTDNTKEKNNKQKRTDDSFSEMKSKKYTSIIENKISSLSSKKIKNNIYERGIRDKMKNELASYDFEFNLNPPDNRLIVPSIGINAPIINPGHYTSEKLVNADFDEELYSGVVQYPFTSNPGEKGNSFIFGHSSFYRWKDNPYGEVFSQIPKLNNGDNIKIVRNGELIEYNIIDTVVKWPSNVGDVYEKYNNKNKDILTLMGCYPIGTQSQRMLIIAERVNQDTDKGKDLGGNLTYK